MTWLAGALLYAAECPNAFRVADEDQVVVRALGRVEEGAGDDFVRRVVAPHRIDREANLPGVHDAADGLEIHRRAP
jgi:hypothetical protein